jgi:adenosine deaminase
VPTSRAHLHVHLESAIRWSTLGELAARNGVPVPSRPNAGFAGLPAFVEHNQLVRDCLRTPADFSRIAREFCADEAADGTGYVEVSFTAAGHGERLGDLDMPLLAVLDGLAQGAEEHGIECRVLLDHSRRRSVERAWRTLDLARRHAARGVIGIGLAGDEAFPATPFAEVCHAARDAGLHLVHHAGEAAGPASIREVLDVGHAERIGHGIRILEDPDLVAEVRERGIPLEVCPSSNVALGFAPSLTEHPIGRLVEAGLLVTVNTDIPAIVGTTLSAEYAAVRWAIDDEQLNRNGWAAIRKEVGPPPSRSGPASSRRPAGSP